MGVKLVDFHNALEKRRTAGYFEDFFWFVTAHLWTSLAADSGASVAVGDSANGNVVITTGGTDNNEAMIRTTNELFLIAADKPLVGEVGLQYSEAATNAANVFAGYANAAAANLMVDDGAGVKTSGSIFGIFKVDGGTVWKAISSISSSQTISTSTTTAGGSAQQKLRIEVQPINSTTAEATFYVDGQQLIDSSTLKPIKHVVTYTGATEMNFCVYAKAGSGSSEVVNADYAAWEHLR